MRVAGEVQLYLLADAGHVRDVPGIPFGLGTSVRAPYLRRLADAKAAIPITAKRLSVGGSRRGQIGVIGGYAF